MGNFTGTANVDFITGLGGNYHVVWVATFSGIRKQTCR